MCGDCGRIGETACAWDGTYFCDPGLAYNSNTHVCAAAAPPTLCTGSYSVPFWLVSPEGCVVAGYWAAGADGAGAAACAEAIAAAVGPGLDIHYYDPPTTYTICRKPAIGYPIDEIEIAAYSEDEALSCIEPSCSDCTYAVTDTGACE